MNAVLEQPAQSVKDNRSPQQKIIDQVIERVDPLYEVAQTTATLITGFSWRVDIWVRVGMGCSRVAQSFYVTTDEDDIIIESDPWMAPAL